MELAAVISGLRNLQAGYQLKIDKIERAIVELQEEPLVPIAEEAPTSEPQKSTSKAAPAQPTQPDTMICKLCKKSTPRNQMNSYMYNGEYRYSN